MLESVNCDFFFLTSKILVVENKMKRPLGQVFSLSIDVSWSTSNQP